MPKEHLYGMRRADDIENLVRTHASDVIENLEKPQKKVVEVEARIYWRDSTGQEAIEKVGQMFNTELVLQYVLMGRTDVGDYSLARTLLEYGKASKPPDGHMLLDDKIPVAITLAASAILAKNLCVDADLHYRGYWVLFVSGRSYFGPSALEMHYLDADDEEYLFFPDEETPAFIRKKILELKSAAVDFMAPFYQGYETKGERAFKFTEI